MRVYLDHNATAPVREEVLAEVVRVLRDVPGNPSSVHAEGAAARRELEHAREAAAALVGAKPDEVVFTAGATEANNLALRGVASAQRARGRHLVATTVEHPSILEPLAVLEAEGWRVTRIPVDADGLVEPAALEETLESDTVLVSLLWANNETGVIQAMAPLAERVKARGVLLHVDATQALGKVPVSLSDVPADLLSGSAHKLGGPKGAGLLVVREGTPLDPCERGGPQERGRRGGTSNVAGAVGLGEACRLAARELPDRMRVHAALRDRLWSGLTAKVPRVRRNGAPASTLPNTLNVEFEGAAGDVLVEALDLEGIAVSAGAACHSGSVSASHVLLGMGRTPEQARASVRFSVGHGVDEAQIDFALARLPDLVARVREVAA